MQKPAKKFSVMEKIVMEATSVEPAHSQPSTPTPTMTEDCVMRVSCVLIVLQFEFDIILEHDSYK